MVQEGSQYSGPIYLDYNATTPLDPAVQDAMLPYLSGRFGNPSSSHWYGTKEKQAVADARSDVAGLLNAKASEIIFTSGGTESVNWTIKGVAELKQGKHIVTSAVEHVVVLECCKYLEKHHGYQVTYVGVDEHGRVSVEDVKQAIKEDTILVTIMHANNETGTINDIKAIAAEARSRGVLMHTDASQSVGKVPINVKDLGVDFLTVAGHKLYAPAGVGALYIKEGLDLPVFMHGAGHEGGRRAGTENTMHLVALGTACRLCKENMGEYMLRMKTSRDELYSLLKAEFPTLRLNGHPEERLVNTLNVSFPPECETNHSMIAGCMDSVSFSAGSACHSDVVNVSHVLKAMTGHLGESEVVSLASRACRFSTGRGTTVEDVKTAAVAIISAAKGGK